VIITLFTAAGSLAVLMSDNNFIVVIFAFFTNDDNILTAYVFGSGGPYVQSINPLTVKQILLFCSV